MEGSHTGARRRYFAWSAPDIGAVDHFEVLIGRRWLLAGFYGLAALGAVLASLPGRRARVLAAMLGASFAGGLIMLGSGVWNALVPMLKRVELPVDGLPPALDGVRIAQVSDLPYGLPLNRAAVWRGLRAVQEAEPDVIVFTGDFVSYARYLRRLPLILAPLHAPYGSFACCGNHDHWAGLSRVAGVLDECGIELLINQHRTIRIRDTELVIAGVDDLWDGRPDLGAALAGAPPDAPIVLLAHSPDYADTAARERIALQLAGHSHGGHIRLPWLGPLLLPRHGIRHDRGLKRVGSMWLYVSHGLGGWPLRIGCRAEVTIFTLRRTSSP